jgi:cytochrome d ubiquinol oxidase subunit I
MDLNVIAARSQMGMSLIFHIIFSVLGVGLPLMLCIAEGIALWRKDGIWLALSHQWTKAFAILFAIGAVSGSIVEFELTLLWPNWARSAGGIIGLPFALEGFAFFIEGIFLGLYLYGAKRLSPAVHWLCSLPIAISGTFSAWFVTTANSWMNSPSGLKIVNGKIIGVDPFQAMLNPSTPFETTHMILACFVTVGFGTAAVYATGILRGKNDEYHRRGMLLGMAVGTLAIPLQIISGDFNARSIVHTQPAKYAAFEGLVHSGRGMPLYIGGIPDIQTGQVYGALQIPHGESLISHFDLNSYARGLDSFSANFRPPELQVVISHLSFDLMVFCGFFMLLIGSLFWLLYFWRNLSIPTLPLLMWGVLIAGICAFLAVEFGWIVTEEGRQPWIIYGIMRVSDAANPVPLMGVSFIVFLCIYIILGATLIIFLLLLARRPKPPMEWSELVIDEAQKGQISQKQEV